MCVPTRPTLGAPGAAPRPPGALLLTEVAADDSDGDLVHEHRPEAHVLLRAALPEGAQDLHLRVVLADAPVRQEPELGAHGGQSGGARRGAGPLRGPGRSLGLAGGRPAGVRGERAPRLRSRRCARRLCSPDPANLLGHSAPPTAPPANQRAAAGAGLAARPAAEAASAGGAQEGRRGRGLWRPGEGSRAGLGAPGSPGSPGSPGAAAGDREAERGHPCPARDPGGCGQDGSQQGGEGVPASGLRVRSGQLDASERRSRASEAGGTGGPPQGSPQGPRVVPKVVSGRTPVAPWPGNYLPKSWPGAEGEGLRGIWILAACHSDHLKMHFSGSQIFLHLTPLPSLQWLWAAEP